MKRIAAIISAVFVLLSLCACAGDPREGTDDTLAIVETPGETESAAVTENSAQTEGSVSDEPDPDTVVSVSPLLWRVTDTNGHELYLFGTIHAGDERNDRVFERISPVLANCDALAVEFDTVAYENDIARMTRDVAQYVLIDGTTISDHMPDELYSRAADLLNRAKMYPELYKKYNLAWWAQLVDTAMLTLYSDLDTEKGMETFLIDFAYEKEMPVLDVESASFQMSLLNSFENELYILLIEDELNGADTYGDELDALYELWLSGDLDAFWGYLATEDDEHEYTEEQIALIEDYDRRLLDDRNLGMFDRAVEYLESGDTVFFAVGAAHMANEAGLVRLLTDAGYTVETVDY